MQLLNISVFSAQTLETVHNNPQKVCFSQCFTQHVNTDLEETYLCALVLFTFPYLRLSN